MIKNTTAAGICGIMILLGILCLVGSLLAAWFLDLEDLKAAGERWTSPPLTEETGAVSAATPRCFLVPGLIVGGLGLCFLFFVLRCGDEEFGYPGVTSGRSIVIFFGIPILVIGVAVFILAILAGIK